MNAIRANEQNKKKNRTTTPSTKTYTFSGGCLAHTGFLFAISGGQCSVSIFHIKFSLTKDYCVKANKIIFCTKTMFPCNQTSYTPRISIRDHYLPRYDFNTCVIIFAFFLRIVFFGCAISYRKLSTSILLCRVKT